MDIREGDILVVGSDEYPIRSCAEWQWPAGRAMRRFLTVTASTKRTPAMAGGKRGVPATHLASLRCTPLDPVDAELAKRIELDTPHELLQTFVEGGATFYHLVLEDLKR